MPVCRVELPFECRRRHTDRRQYLCAGRPRFHRLPVRHALPRLPRRRPCHDPRQGEKILQRVGARKPMQWGASITTAGIAMMGLTFLPDLTYTVVVFVGFCLFGLPRHLRDPVHRHLRLQCTVRQSRPGAGVYKMASSLGGAFGVAISAAVYGAFAESTNLAAAATAGILVNVAFGLLAILAIITLIPRGIGRMEDEMEETEMAVSESYNQ